MYLKEHSFAYTPLLRTNTVIPTQPNYNIFRVSLNVLFSLCKEQWRFVFFLHTVTDMINALLGNSPVNTFQHRRHATIDEAVFNAVRAAHNADNGPMNSQSDTWHVFSMWSASSNRRTMGLCNPFLGNASVNTFPRIVPWYATRWRHQK
jgi:hypothetical protein